jgi:hypothetical protein
MRRALWIVVLVLLCSPLALADAPQTGVVTGTVTDPEGRPLPGATVQIMNEQGTMVEIADQNGSFMFVFLVPGLYTVQADMSGFRSVAGEIVVSAGGRADVELKLSEAMGEEIVVTGESPLVSRFHMTGGGTVNAEELRAITGSNREYKSRLMFMPDVFNEVGSDEYLGREPSVAGNPGIRTAYFIDGIDVSFARKGGGSQLELPSTAIAEMQLVSMGADAEHGRAVGGYTMTIIRSGTNSFHGSASWKGENLAWNAENEVNPSERRDEIVSSYDFTLGGPIVRDKLWFFLLYRSEKTPGYYVLADGVSVVEEGIDGGARLGKLDWRPNPAHSVMTTYTETPYELPFGGSGDLPTVSWFDTGSDLASGRWNWAITDDLLLTVAGGTTKAKQDREPYVESPIEPGCGPGSPCGNGWLYLDLSTGIAFNAVTIPLGNGYTNFPRDQANASLEWFTGKHDIKFGLDYQKVAWNTAGVSPPFCRGVGYDEHAPSGFTDPDPRRRPSCRFYPDKATWETEGWGPTEHGSDNTALYIKDRIALDRWTFNLGARVDRQYHENDVGETVIDSTLWMPRVAASYDLLGDSTLILNASAGRYYAQMHLSWSGQFNEGSQGRAPGSPFEEYRFNPATGDYDIFRYINPGRGARDVVQVDPYYLDGATLGAEWQFHRHWALKAMAYHWKKTDFPQYLEQVDPTPVTGGSYFEVTTDPGARAERKALTLSLQRRFRNGWMVAANYSLSETKDNCSYGATQATQCGTGFGELLVWTTEDGTPMSYYNEWGGPGQDRTHIAKVRGAYQLRMGRRHSLNIGGIAYYVHGRPWAPGTYQVIPPEINPLGEDLGMLVNDEPRGSRRINGRTQLDLNLEWQFPIGGQFNGWVRTEIVNALNDQVQIGTAGMSWSGVPNQSTANYQYPRRVRAYVGFSF